MRPFAFLTGLLLFGCVITEVVELKTGLFNNDLKQLSDAYEKVDALGRGKVTKKQVEEMGFDFRAANVERVSGPDAFRRIFGDTAFQGAFSDIKNVNPILEEMKQYKSYLIPYKNIITSTDRYYFTTKEKVKKGDDLLILMMFKNELLFYSDYKYVKIDTKESTSAFAQGFFDILKEFLGPTDALYDLIDKLRKEFN